MSAVFEGDPCDDTKWISVTIVITENGVPIKIPVTVRGDVIDSSGDIVSTIEENNFDKLGGYFIADHVEDIFPAINPGTYEISVKDLFHSFFSEDQQEVLLGYEIPMIPAKATVVVPECERVISVSAVFEGNPCDYTKKISTTIVFTEGGVPAKTPVIIRGFIKDSSGAIVEDIDTHNFGIRYVSGGYIVSSLPVDAQAVHSFRPQEPGTYEITINKVLPNHIEDGSLVTGDPIQTSPQKVTVVVPACDVGGMVQLIPVTTLNFDGKDYPITQFTLWQWQGECDDSWHYHTPTANAVEIETLTGKSDPDFNNCGFGKTSSIFISTFWATPQQLQAFRDNTGIDPVGNGEAQFGGQGP